MSEKIICDVFSFPTWCLCLDFNLIASILGPCIFSSPEPKADGELIGWYLSRRPCVHPCVCSHFQRFSLKLLGQILSMKHLQEGGTNVY